MMVKAQVVLQTECFVFEDIPMLESFGIECDSVWIQSAKRF